MAKYRGGHGLKGTDLGQLAEAAALTTSNSRLIELAHVTDTSIHFELTDNPRTPLEALLVLVRGTSSAQVILEALRHPNFTEAETPAAFERMYTLRPKLALQNGLCPRSVFAKALESGDEQQLLWSAANSMCPGDMLALLGASPIGKVRAAVAANPYAGESLVSALAGDEKAHVRAAVARRLDITSELEKRLLEDRALTVLRALAANHRATPTTQRIAKSREYGIKSYRDRLAAPDLDRRLAALVKGGMSREYFEDLRVSKVASVRVTAKLLAYDTDILTLDECLAELATERQNGFVRKFLKHIDPVRAMHIVAARGITQPLDGLLRPDWIRSAEVARLAVRNGVFEQVLQVTQWCPLEVDVLDMLSRMRARGTYFSLNSDYKYGLAFRFTRTYASRAAMRRRSQRYGYLHPAAVPALHPDTSEATLKRLRQSRDVYVRAAMVWRHDAAMLEREARGPARVRWAIAMSPNTPADILSQLAYDVDENVCAAAAANPNTRPEDRALVALIGEA